MLVNLTDEEMLMKGSNEEDEYFDYLVDYKAKMVELYNILDPSVKMCLRRRGVSVMQNTYSGFDTEYELNKADITTNKLISVQLAVNTRTYIKIPLERIFEVSGINALNGEKYLIKRISGFNYTMLENSLSRNIKIIKSKESKKHDEMLLELSDTFKQMSEKFVGKLNYFEKDDYMVVSLPRSFVSKYVYLNEDNKGYSFAEVVNKSLELGNPNLDRDYIFVKEIIRDILNKYDVKLLVGKEDEDEDGLTDSNFVSEDDEEEGDNEELEAPNSYEETDGLNLDGLNLDDDEVLDSPNLEIEESNILEGDELIEGKTSFAAKDLEEKMGEEFDYLEDIKAVKEEVVDVNSLVGFEGEKRYKSLSRSKMRSIDLNISVIKKLYVISHLTNADLSMLNDFNMLKEELNIVNKSFVSLGKFRYRNMQVIIRDTKLLAPAGKQSLASLGNLIGISKISLLQSDYEKMSWLLKNDRQKFIDYAITDSVITLAYANYLEEQGFGIKKLGIPITLSSFAADYVRHE